MPQDEKLQQYFNFTQDDLLANQQGRVTENQQEHVKGKVQNFNNRILIVLIVVFLIGLAVNSAIRTSYAVSNGFPIPLPTPMLGPVIVITLMVVFMSVRSKKKNNFSLKKVEGTVNFVWVERQVSNQDRTGYKTEKSLQMRVGGVSFNVNQKLMDVINEGDTCRFYYTGGGDIISAEFIDKP